MNEEDHTNMRSKLADQTPRKGLIKLVPKDKITVASD